MNKNLNQIIYLLKKDLGLLLSISFGVFLFVLFFQPFPLDTFDFNNTLLFVAGLGAIVFLFMVLVRVAFPWLINKYDHNNHETMFSSFLGGFILVVMSSVAFAFYLHYVGLVSLSFFIMFKVVLICLSTPVALRLYDLVKQLKQQNESLIRQKETIQKQIDNHEEADNNKSIEFISENSTENLNLRVRDVAFIKSADNYVEIFFKEGDQFKKKLIRNTLKNIEQQLKPYTGFIRCHRICIVNAYHVEKLNKELNTHWLTITGYDEQIPVSRQYLLKLKETL